VIFLFRGDAYLDLETLVGEDEGGISVRKLGGGHFDCVCEMD
jgi:hypothetical protein